MSPQSPLEPRNNVKIARSRGEALTWRGRGIVVDLFRFSNTICALLQSGRRDVRVYPTPELALSASRRSGGHDIFSEMDLPVEHYDNSPYEALRAADLFRPAFSVTKSGSKAAGALLLAEEILVGCFANSPALAAYCGASPMPTLIVPACLFYDASHVEDLICARALEAELGGEEAFPDALREIHASGRVMDFLAFRPETGRRDLELILRKGSYAVVPRIRFRAGTGRVDDAAASA